MNKKYLIIKASARENGYTNKLCGELVEMLGEENVQVFNTYKESFNPCNGCNYCQQHGACANRDLDVFYTSFEQCDVVIFLSPVYNGTFSAPLKSLIDRFQVYYTTFYENNKIQPISKKRTSYFIAASGRDGSVAFEYMKNQLRCAFTILNIELKGAFLCSNTDTQSNYENVSDQIKRSLKSHD